MRRNTPILVGTAFFLRFTDRRIYELEYLFSEVDPLSTSRRDAEAQRSGWSGGSPNQYTRASAPAETLRH
jgi:hypothetical protein